VLHHYYLFKHCNPITFFVFRRKQYIGNVVHANFDIVSPIKKIIVATDQNVLAALSIKSGEIIWRQLLESGRAGEIISQHVDDEIVTISGTLSPLVRGWDLENGHILYEWAVSTSVTKHTPKWLVVEDTVVAVQFPPGEVLATWFNLRTGATLTSKKTAFDVDIPADCVGQGTHVVCLASDGVLSVIATGKAGSLEVNSAGIAENVKNFQSAKLSCVRGQSPLVTLTTADDQYVISIAPTIKVLNFNLKPTALLSSAPVDHDGNIVVTELQGNVSIRYTTNRVWVYLAIILDKANYYGCEQPASSF